MGRKQLTRAGAGLLLVLGLMGCTTDPGWPKCYPVSGKVLIDGKPAVRASVTFHPKTPQADGKTYGPSTFTDDNGEFRLTTFAAADGAPAGEYTVTIVAEWVQKGGQDAAVPDLLKGQYADPKSSKLTATIREEPTVLPVFDLRSSRN